MRWWLIAALLSLLGPSAAFAQVEQDPAPADEAPATDVDAVDEADAAAPEVAAQEAELRAQIGRMALGRGELDTAAVELERAQRLDPGADRLLELAAVLEALRREDELMGAYRVYLRRVPDGDRAAEVRARLAILADRSEPPAPPEVACEAQRSSAPDEPSGEQTLLAEPWFYVVVGLVVLSAIAGISAATDAGASETPPLPGDDGVVVHTLVAW